jgi:poly-beta-1,6-N-acetyl-D-glucosamine synthase
VAAGLADGRDEPVVFSVGVMAYNEEASIADAIESILSQKPDCGTLDEVTVVASGCEDRTCEIVAEIAKRDSRVKLIEQSRREGKASAVNLFIAAARAPVLVLVSADLVVADGALEAMLCHFTDPTVGMAGARPVPVNQESTFLGHAVHLQWRLHHRISGRHPKMGEMVAFRNVVPSIPGDTAVDELSIQALITQLGYHLVYEPQALVYNRGPATVADFLRQRRRIYAGHRLVRARQAYAAPTMSAWRAARALTGSGAFRTPRSALWSVGAISLEVLARFLGFCDMIRRRPSHVWEMVDSTKHQVAQGAAAHSMMNVLVLHLVNFSQHELDIGTHAGRQLARRVADEVSRALGSQARVTVQQGGTIIAMLPGTRDDAERAARALVTDVTAAGVKSDGQTRTRLELSCAVISFPQTGTGAPVAGLIPVVDMATDPTLAKPVEAAQATTT